MNGSGNTLLDAISWGTHPTYSTGTAGQWLAGLALIIVAAFLWAMVLREID